MIPLIKEILMAVFSVILTFLFEKLGRIIVVKREEERRRSNYRRRRVIRKRKKTTAPSQGIK